MDVECSWGRMSCICCGAGYLRRGHVLPVFLWILFYPLEHLLLSLERQAGVPFTPQTGAVQRGPTASMSDEENYVASVFFLENGGGR